MLGNYKSTPVFFDGIEVGEDCSSDNFKVGKHCTGSTVDGKTVCRFSLDLDDNDSPEMGVTNIFSKYVFNTSGCAALDDWEKLFEDALTHIRALKK